MTIEIRSEAGEARLAYRQDHRKTLVAPRDDMWAAFAAMAEPYAIIVEGEVVGCCAVNDERELHHFYLAPECEDRGESIFAYFQMVETEDPLQTGRSVFTLRPYDALAVEAAGQARRDSIAAARMRMCRSTDLEVLTQPVRSDKAPNC